MTPFTESVVEKAALAWLESAGWTIRHGADTVPGEIHGERDTYSETTLDGRLRDALVRLNPDLPSEAVEDAFRRLQRLEGADVVARNRHLHRMLVDGVTVEYRAQDHSIRGTQVKVIDFDNISANDFVAINQFTIVENKHTRRPDIVLFVNGLPLVVIELKNAAEESATIWSAYKQLQTYKAEIPALFDPNEVLVISDGVQARVGTLTAGKEWFKPWRSLTKDGTPDPYATELETVIRSLLGPERLLSLMRDFIVFEDDGGGAIIKKMAGYHQFHAVEVAVEETLRAGGATGDRRVGVVWHTQGAGKSLTMAFMRAGSSGNRP